MSDISLLTAGLVVAVLCWLVAVGWLMVLHQTTPAAEEMKHIPFRNYRSRMNGVEWLLFGGIVLGLCLIFF